MIDGNVIAQAQYVLRSSSIHNTVCSPEYIITTIHPAYLVLSWNRPTSPIFGSISFPFYVWICNITTSPLSSTVYHLLILSLLFHFLSLFIHPALVHLSIYPFISKGMWEAKLTHLMGLCVSRKWLARVSHWLYRWATHCCPHLQWCQRKCHISWEELGKKSVKIQTQDQHFNSATTCIIYT